MILIGERINAGFSDIAEAIDQREKGAVQKWAKKQSEQGADYLDINMGAVSKNPADMIWLVETVQGAVETAPCIDAQRLEIFEEALPHCEGEVLINSTTAEPSELNSLLPLAVEHDASIIGVTRGEGGSPQDVAGRVENGTAIFSAAMEHGLPAKRIFLDPIAMPIKFMQEQARNFLEAIRQLTMLSDPPPHISMGLSNVSSEAKKRSLINRIFLVMAMAVGADAAICDVTDSNLMNAVATAEIILDEEIYSDSYHETYRMG